MKYLLIIIVVLSSFSCKKEMKQSHIKPKVVIDTTYCDYSKKSIITKDSIDLYNKLYYYTIEVYNLLDDKIILNSDKKVEICYKKEAEIIFSHKKDTVFNVKINSSLLHERYKEFYQSHLKGQSEKDSKYNIPEPINSLKLDSVVLLGARSNYLYFSTFSTDYKSNQNYQMNIWVKYLEVEGSDIMVEQLEVIK